MDIQTNRHSRLTDRQIDGQRWKDRKTTRQTNINILTYKQTETDIYTEIQNDRWVDRQRNGETKRQTNK